MALPTIGTVKYAGIEFDARSRTKISWKPIPDKAGRTTKFIEISLDVNGWISGNTTDAQMLNLRQKLGEPGGALIYTSKGFGDLQVNVGAKRDVQWGPWPEVLEYDPVGSNQAARIHWRCTTRIPECQGARFTGGPLEFCYTVDYTIDQDGYTQIRVDGEVVIPMTRKGGADRSLPDTADRLREQIFPEVPTGFQRGPQSWRLSEDKRTAYFGYTDQELPEALPPGVTRADIHHRLRASRSTNKGFAIWNGSITGNITTQRGEPKVEGYKKFLIYVNQVLAAARVQAGNQVADANGNAAQAAAGAGGAVAGFLGDSNIKPVIPKGPKGTIFLESISIDDDVLGRSATYGVDYRIIGCSIDAFVEVSGMFRYSGWDWVKWKDSLKMAAFHPRGFARLKHIPQQEVIIDLCVAGGSLKPSVAGKNIAGGKVPGNVPGKSPGKPAVDCSWVFFQNHVEMKEEGGLARHIPIGEDEQERPGPDAAKTQAISQAVQTAKAVLTTATPTVIQKVRPTIYRCMMIGSALRLGHPITPPSLKKVGDVVPTAGRRQVKEGEARKIGDVPLYHCTWAIEYLFDRPPNGTVDMGANPMEKVDGGAAAGIAGGIA